MDQDSNAFDENPLDKLPYEFQNNEPALKVGIVGVVNFYDIITGSQFTNMVEISNIVQERFFPNQSTLNADIQWACIDSLNKSIKNTESAWRDHALFKRLGRENDPYVLYPRELNGHQDSTIECIKILHKQTKEALQNSDLKTIKRDVISNIYKDSNKAVQTLEDLFEKSIDAMQLGLDHGFITFLKDKFFRSWGEEFFNTIQGNGSRNNQAFKAHTLINSIIGEEKFRMIASSYGIILEKLSQEIAEVDQRARKTEEAFAQHIAQHMESESEILETPKTKYFTLPTRTYGNELSGRKVEKQKVIDLIRQDEPGRNIINIYGLSGIGKSAVSLQVGYELNNEETEKFDAIIWASAQKHHFRGNSVNLVAQPVDTPEKLYQKINTSLGSISEYETFSINRDLFEKSRTLLILDNFESFSDKHQEEILFAFENLPEHTRILITSVDPIYSTPSIHLESLDPEETKELINNRWAQVRREGQPENLNEQIKELISENTRGRPGLIRWALGQMADEDWNTNRIIKELKRTNSPSTEFYISRNFERLGENEKNILYSLSLFNGKAYPYQIAQMVGMNEEDYEFEDALKRLQRLPFLNKDFLSYTMHPDSLEGEYVTSLLNEETMSDLKYLFKQRFDTYVGSYHGQAKELKFLWDNLGNPSLELKDKYSLLENLISISQDINDTGSEIGARLRFAKILFNLNENDKSTDQLLKVLNVAENRNQYNPRVQADAYDLLGRIELRKENYNTALDYFNQQIESLSNLDGVLNTVPAIRNKAILYLKSGEISKAENLLLELLSVYQENQMPVELASTLTRLAELNIIMDNFKQAEVNLAESIDISELHGLNIHPTVFENLGHIQNSFYKDVSKAEEYHGQALQSINETGQTVELVYMLNRVGNRYITLEQYDLAIEYFEQSYRLCGLDSQEENSMNFVKDKDRYFILDNLGKAYFNKREFEQSIAYFTQSLDFIKTSKERIFTLGKLADSYRELSKLSENDERAAVYRQNAIYYNSSRLEIIQNTVYEDEDKMNNYAYTIYELAQLYGQSGSYDLAKRYYEENIEIRQNIKGNDNYRILIYSYEHLAKLEELEGELESALNYYKKAVDFNITNFRDTKILNFSFQELQGFIDRHTEQVDLHNLFMYSENYLNYVHDSTIKANILEHLGTMSAKYGNKDSADYYLSETLDLYRTINSQELLYVLNRLGKLYINLGYYESAKIYLEEGFDLALQLNNRKSRAYNLKYLGKAHLELGKEDLESNRENILEARKYLRAAYQLETREEKRNEILSYLQETYHLIDDGS